MSKEQSLCKSYPEKAFISDKKAKGAHLIFRICVCVCVHFYSLPHMSLSTLTKHSSIPMDPRKLKCIDILQYSLHDTAVLGKIIHIFSHTWCDVCMCRMFWGLLQMFCKYFSYTIAF